MKKTKHRGQNKVRARCRGVEVGEHVYTFEQVPQSMPYRLEVNQKGVLTELGGVRFRRRGSRKQTFVSFESLVANSEGVRHRVGDEEYSFSLTEEGLKVKSVKKGVKVTAVTSWEVLVNLSRKQPVLFEEAA